jgi:radical SAM superfamily enzyme YgiQ (UPF0313 family)
MDLGFEQGPIRPPSEAASLLVRVSRNCPWNRCAFCPVYRGQRFSLRPVEEVLADLDAMRTALGDNYASAFLQDANPLVTRPDDLVRMVEAIRQRFPRVQRFTAYARAHTLTRRSTADLRRVRQAGLNRLHVGLESGCDAVLQLVNKGVTRAQQIEGALRAREAGFELSLYVMPGLGGRQLSNRHADDTASALEAAQPDFIRLRTTTPVPGTELARMQEQGEIEPLTEVETVRETRRLLAGLDTTEARLESDHVMNLLIDLNGQLPGDRERLLGLCDDLLELPHERQQMFVLARRLGWLRRPCQLDDLAVTRRLRAVLEEVGGDPESLFAELRGRVL